MKFNYNVYRPKKLIQDVRRVNNSYFHSKDIRLTPLTKIGDAYKLHKEQTAGRQPTLGHKLKPHQLTLKALRVQRFRRPINVRNASQTKKVTVRVLAAPAQNLALGHKAAVSSDQRPSWQWPAILRVPKFVQPLVFGLAVLLGGAGIGGLQLVNASHLQAPTTQGTAKQTNNPSPFSHKQVALLSRAKQPSIPHQSVLRPSRPAVTPRPKKPMRATTKRSASRNNTAANVITPAVAPAISSNNTKQSSTPAVTNSPAQQPSVSTPQPAPASTTQTGAPSPTQQTDSTNTSAAASASANSTQATTDTADSTTPTTNNVPLLSVNSTDPTTSPTTFQTPSSTTNPTGTSPATDQTSPTSNQ